MLVAVLISPFTWFTMGLITIPLYLLGWVLVPLAAALKAYRFEDTVSIYGESVRHCHFTWPFMYIWDNWEDGCLDGKEYKDFKNDFLQIVYWSCWRNPVNNLRTVPYLSCKLDPDKIEFYWFNDYKPVRNFCWQFPYTVLYYEFTIYKYNLRLWVGWKINPLDTIRTDFGYRGRGAGFTCQIKVL